MNEFYYCFYGYNIKTNFEIPFFPVENKKPDIIDVTFNAMYGNNATEEMFISNDNNCCTVISPYASYEINTVDKFIEARYNEMEQLYSTMFNVPFSILAISKNDLLFHCSSISCTDYIYAFTGEKGMGKSTMISHLSRKFNFFSDDTLNIKMNEGLRGYSYGDFLKLDEASFLTHMNIKKQVFDCAAKNIQEKAYLYTSDLNLLPGKRDALYLRKIYILNRENRNNITLNRIDNIMRKKFLIINNTVGASFLPKEFLWKLFNNSIVEIIVKNIPIYQINIPDNLSYLNDVVENVEKDIGGDIEC